MNLRYTPAAVGELEENAKWLERRKPGEGNKFADAFEAAIKEIVADPQHWPRFESALELAPDRDIRRFVMQPFPHMVIFEIKNDFIIVLAVMHPSRDPAYWLDRLS